MEASNMKIEVQRRCERVAHRSGKQMITPLFMPAWSVAASFATTMSHPFVSHPVEYTTPVIRC